MFVQSKLGRQRTTLTLVSVLLLLASFGSLHAQVQNVDDLIETAFSGLRFNRFTNTFDSTATLTNISAIPVSEPHRLVITSINPSSVTLANATDVTEDEGLPFVEVATDDGTLSPGEQATVVLKFNNPSRVNFTFASAVLGVPGGGPPIPLVVAITSPSNLSLFGSSPIAVTGTVDDPSATVTVNGIAATNGSGSFSASVPLKEGNNTIVAIAQNSLGGLGTASIQVTLDTTPPTVTFDSPPDGFVTTTPTVTVAGMINDIVVGTVNGDQATVTVNGAAAQVANRSFLATDLPLQPGPNIITAVGTDKAGNTGTASISVVFQEQALGQPVIQSVSGNNQTGIIGSQLANPLLVALKNGAGGPAANKTVIFKVKESNGTLSNSPDELRSLAVTTNAQGLAQVNWKLGTRSGAGNNVVEASAIGFQGKAIFTATALSGAPGKINVDAGNGQTGATSQPLARPFAAVVTDSGNNRLGGIPVSFTVQEGAGTFQGMSSFVVNTDSDGRALATLTLGSVAGLNRVEATFAGNFGFPAVFTAEGREPGDALATRISGVVLDNSNIPVPGVTMHLEGTGSEVMTDEQGQFLIQPAPVGPVELVADGSTASRPGRWPILTFDLVTVSGQNNTLGMPIFLLPLSENELCVSPVSGGTLTLSEVPGFSLEVASDSATFPDGSKSGCVSTTLVHTDKVPMVPNFGQQPRFIVTIQPAGVLFDPPAPITIPNLDGLAPGQVTELYSFDHDLQQFVSIGPGTVSEDGLIIASDPGVGIIKGGWHCGGDPQATGSCCQCSDCHTCQGSTCVPDDSQDPGPCLMCENGTPVALELENEPCRECQNDEITNKPNGPISSSECCFEGEVQPNQPIQDLSKCPNRVSNPSHVPGFNGCGGSGLSSLVPDNPTLTVNITNPVYLALHGFSDGDFTPPCNQHDICYDTCNTVKSSCDSNFGAQMDSVCNTDYTGLLSAPFLDQCLGFSLIYEGAVSSIESFYENAQKNACNCCSN